MSSVIVASWTDPDSANIVAIWYLQETVQPSGALDDISTNDFDAASVSFPVYRGKDLGYELPGSGDYFDAGTNFGNEIGDAISNLSFAARVQFDLTSGNDGFANIGDFSSSQGEFGMSILADKLRLTVDNAGGDLRTSFTRTDENHIAGTYDGLTLRLYTNGVEHSTLSYTSSLNCNGLRGIIGGFYSPSFVLDGRINDARWYSRTITSNEVLMLATTAVANLAIDTISINDLVAYYPATNNMMGAHDDSGNFLGAKSFPTFTNAPTFGEIAGTNGDGRIQYVARGDGSDDKLRMKDLHDTNGVLDFGTNDFTVSVWFNIDAHKNNRVIGKGIHGGAPGFGIIVSSAGVVRFILDGASSVTITNDAPLSTGQWYQVVGVREYGIELSMWVDGVKQADTNNETLDITGTEDFGVFGFGNTSENLFDGLIGTVRIYDKVITNIPAIHTNTYMPNGDIEARLSNP